MTLTKEHIWHEGLSHTGTFLLQNYVGNIAAPDMWRRDTWNLLTAERNVDTHGLVDNSARHILSKACRQSLLSLRTHMFTDDCTMYGLKCFTASDMERASSLQGSHVC